MNRSLTVQGGGRIVIMDRVRLALVILVVFMHSAAAYTNVISWWSVQETPKSRLLDLFVLFADGFQMPFLYFIAGYFAYNSIENRTGSDFIISKLKRIGIPFMAIGLFFTPYISYIGIRRITTDAPGFFNFWIFQMKTAADFTPVLFSDHEMAKLHGMDYSLWHLWFVTVLLALYMLYAGFVSLKKRFRPGGFNSRTITNKEIVTAMVISLIIMALVYSVINVYIKEWVWGKSGIFSVQPTRIPLYIVIFFLGVYAGSGNLFVKGGMPGKTWIWGTAFIVLSAALIACMYYLFMTWGEPTPYPFALLHGVIRGGVIIASLGFFINLAYSRREKKSFIDSMSDYSYEIYIIHLPLLIAVAYLLRMVTMPLILKFVFAGCIVASLSFAAGRYIIKPYPKAATALIAVFFFLLCLVYR